MKDEALAKGQSSSGRKSTNRQKKEALVAELAEKVAKAKAIVFANYQGMTHHQIEGLKRSLKSSDAEMVVAKNTLIKIALEQTGHSLQSTAVDGSPSTVDGLKGGTIALFAYNDVVAPIKELAKSFKALNLPEVKFGFLEGKPMVASDVLKLATLPSREVLLAQLVGGLKSPIFGLHRSLNWNLQKFVMTLKAIEAKKA